MTVIDSNLAANLTLDMKVNRNTYIWRNKKILTITQATNACKSSFSFRGVDRWWIDDGHQGWMNGDNIYIGTLLRSEEHMLCQRWAAGSSRDCSSQQQVGKSERGWAPMPHRKAVVSGQKIERKIDHHAKKGRHQTHHVYSIFIAHLPNPDGGRCSHSSNSSPKRTKGIDPRASKVFLSQN